MNSDSLEKPEIDPDLRDWSVELGRVAAQLALYSREVREILNQHLDQAELVEIEFLILGSLIEHPDTGVLQNELGTSLKISPARLSKAIDRLRLKGLVELDRDSADRRRQYVCLTQAGWTQVLSAIDRLLPLYERCREHWPQERLRDWVVEAFQLLETCRGQNDNASSTSSVDSTESESSYRNVQGDAA